MTEYTAYFWADHEGMTYGVKLTRDIPWGEDAPLRQEFDCLVHEDCIVVVPAVTKKRYEYLQSLDHE